MLVFCERTYILWKRESCGFVWDGMGMPSVRGMQRFSDALAGWASVHDFDHNFRQLGKRQSIVKPTRIVCARRARSVHDLAGRFRQLGKRGQNGAERLIVYPRARRGRRGRRGRRA